MLNLLQHNLSASQVVYHVEDCEGYRDVNR